MRVFRRDILLDIIAWTIAVPITLLQVVLGVPDDMGPRYRRRHYDERRN